MIEVFTTEEASAQRLGEIRRLLDMAFEGSFSDDDWNHQLGGWHATVRQADPHGAAQIVSHGSVVMRALEVGGQTMRTGYVEAVATHPGHRGRGLGSEVMVALGRVIRAEFEMGALSTSSHGFYLRHGWERWRGPTYVRSGAALHRSTDEDDGIMVLRFGASEAIDLAASLTCCARRGDDW